MLANFDDIEFHIFKRSMYDIDTKHYNNVHNYVDESSSKIIEILKKCQYSMLFPQGTYYEEKMTGSIPISYSTGCRIITTNQIKDLYGIHSCFIIDTNSDPIVLPSYTENDTELVYEELYQLKERRDKWYDLFIQDIYNGK
jgi:hypothetical protein